MFVFVQGPAESVVSSDVEMTDRVGFGERGGQRAQWSGVGDAVVWPVFVVEALELAQGTQRACAVRPYTSGLMT